MFKSTFLGHAGWLIRNKEFKCLCDPWLTKHGAYFGEWYQFPANHHLLNDELISDLDFIYISHVHEDHYDRCFLDQVSKDVPIVIPDFVDKSFYNKIINLGFIDVRELNKTISESFSGITIKIIKEEGYLDADSCLFLSDGNKNILNLNDCHIDFDLIKNIVGQVDLLLLQSSNAIWWPCCYEYEDEKKKKLGKLKRDNILKRTLEYCRVLEAKNVIANAGPPIFISEDLDEWNYNRREPYNPFILMDDSTDYLIQNGVNSHLVIPGSTFYLSNSPFIDTPQDEINKIYDNYETYLSEYLKELRSLPKNISGVYTKNVVSKFRKQLERIKKASKFYVDKINYPVMFDFGYLGKWVLDFTKEELLTEYTNQLYNYRFNLDPEKVALTISGKVKDFEYYFLSCLFTCSRNPDEYNEFLFAMLKHFDLKRLSMSESLYADRENVLDETFVLKHGDSTYEVQKYCPHMLANLEKTGFIDNGFLVCPLHGWKFSLENGKCENNQGFCLKVRKNDKK